MLHEDLHDRPESRDMAGRILEDDDEAVVAWLKEMLPEFTHNANADTPTEPALS